jgi:hypothetical protein
MIPKMFLLACLFASTVCAQTPRNAGGQPQQQPAVNVVVPPSPNVVVVGGGLYGTAVYPLGYLPIAPSQNWTPPLAGTAGISFLAPPTYPGAGSSYANQVYYSNPASPYYNATPVYSGGEAAAGEEGRAVYDLGPSYYVKDSESAAGAAPPSSLAELAAQSRKNVKHATRTYTNADADRFGGNSIVPGIVPGTKPPSQQQPPPATKPTPRMQKL